VKLIVLISWVFFSDKNNQLISKISSQIYELLFYLIESGGRFPTRFRGLHFSERFNVTGAYWMCITGGQRDAWRFFLLAIPSIPTIPKSGFLNPTDRWHCILFSTSPRTVFCTIYTHIVIANSTPPPWISFSQFDPSDLFADLTTSNLKKNKNTKIENLSKLWHFFDFDNFWILILFRFWLFFRFFYFENISTIHMCTYT